MKINASKTKTMIVSWSRTVHPQLTPLTLDGTVLLESADLVILGVTFDAKMTFEKHLRSVSSAAAQRLGIMSGNWPKRRMVDHSELGLHRLVSSKPGNNPDDKLPKFYTKTGS